MNIFENKYIKNSLSLLFFLTVLCILLDSILRPIFGSYLPEEKLFLAIVGIIYLVFFIYQVIKKEINLISVLFLMIILVSIISSIVNNIELSHCYTSVFYHISLVFVFSYFSTFKKNLLSRTKYIFLGISAILFFYAALSLVLYILTSYFNIILPFNTWLGVAGNNRLYGITGNPAATGVLAYMGIIIQMYLLSSSKKKSILLILLSAVIISVEAATLILSDARGSMISLALLVIMLLILYLKKYNFKNKITKVIIIVLSIVLIAFGLAFVIYRFFGMNRTIHVDFSSIGEIEAFLETISSARYSLWKETIQMIIQKPLFGVGIDNLAPAADVLLKTGTIVTYRFEGPHNVLLDVAVSSGLIGLGISLVIFFFIFRSCYILMRKRYTFSNVVLVSGIVGMFIISLFDYGIFFRGRFMSALFWMFAGYAYCLAKRTKS